MIKHTPPDTMPVRGRYDVVVIGGGLAGVCAAVAAARLGSNTALVQDRPVLGGAASSENHVNISGADVSGYALTRYARETGILEEFLLENLVRNPLHSPWVRDVLLWEMVKSEPKLTVYLNALADEAILAEDGRIAGFTVRQVNTEERYSILGDWFVDCSGDGRIAADAGAAFRIGREARSEFHESLAEDTADSKTLPSALIFRARRMDHVVPFVPPPWARRFPTDADLPFRSHDLIRHAGAADSPYGFWWISCGGDGSTINDAEKIRDTLLPVLVGMWDHLKNCGDHGLENYALDWIAPMPIRRESRRFEGDVMPTQQDVLDCTLYDDRVAYAGWPIDLHPPEGIFSPEPPNISIRLTELWSIPLGSLYSRNIPNLLFAGRNISQSHVALGSSRVMATCAVEGQAAGTAAHFCHALRVSPRELRTQHIAQVQQSLLKQGCYIPSLANQDPADLARAAHVTASSASPLVTQEQAASFALLDRARAQLFPVSTGRIESVALLLRSERPAPVSVRLGLRRAGGINDWTASDDLVSCEAQVAPGTHWVSFPLHHTAATGGLYWIWLPPCEGLAWGEQPRGPLGANRASAGDVGERNRPHYAARVPRWFSERGAYLVKLNPESRPYEAVNVTNGVTRAEAWPNAWLSDPAQGLPQWLELDFGEPRTLDSVYLTFDSDLDTNLTWWAMCGLIPMAPLPQIVRDYRLLGRIQGAWQPLLVVEGNYQGRRVHRFAPIKVEALRLEILATNGAPGAAVYEIRAYHEGR